MAPSVFHEYQDTCDKQHCFVQGMSDVRKSRNKRIPDIKKNEGFHLEFMLCSGHLLTKFDLDTLNDHKWLDTNIINGYLSGLDDNEFSHRSVID